MKTEVSTSIEELKNQFKESKLTIREDGQGGAYVLLNPVSLSEKFFPNNTWMGFQIPAQYPYADIYPVFIGSEIRRKDGLPLSGPITPGHHFEGRTALQVSRRNGSAQSGLQKAPWKILKVLDFLEKLS